MSNILFPEYIIHLQNAVKKLAFVNDMHDHVTSEFKTGKLSVLIFRSFWVQGIYKICVVRSIQKKKYFCLPNKGTVRK